jgi:hypothetical protein
MRPASRTPRRRGLVLAGPTLIDFSARRRCAQMDASPLGSRIAIWIARLSNRRSRWHTGSDLPCAPPPSIGATGKRRRRLERIYDDISAVCTRRALQPSPRAPTPMTTPSGCGGRGLRSFPPQAKRPAGVRHRRPRLRRLKPLTPTFTPATHSAMACCRAPDCHYLRGPPELGDRRRS